MNQLHILRDCHKGDRHSLKQSFPLSIASPTQDYAKCLKLGRTQPSMGIAASDTTTDEQGAEGAAAPGVFSHYLEVLTRFPVSRCSWQLSLIAMAVASRLRVALALKV